MKEYTTDSPVFSESINKFETTDPAHADLFNKVILAVFENTLTLKNILGQDAMEQAFYNAFPDAKQQEDPTALSSSDIDRAVSTEWNGESSLDTDALSSSDINRAVSTEWNGETSSDPTAIESSTISDICN